MQKQTLKETITSVPLLDLNAQYKPIEDEIIQALKEVVVSKKFIMGPEIEALEKNIADYCQCKYAVGVSSGTDALIISLMAMGIGYGDEVITTPFTFFATAGSIVRVGATPVFVDIDPDTFNINPDLIEEKITKKTKAIIPVHLFGQMADMDRVNDIAERHNLFVIEDAAQAIGSNYLSRDGNTRSAGSVGDTGCFSFFPSKNLGCCGDGGIVTTNSSDIAEKLKLLRNHGAKQRYYHDFSGGNFRLDSMQAAVLLVKLRFLEGHHKGRQTNADYYNEKLGSSVVIPYVKDGFRMIYNQYTIRLKNRDKLQKQLIDNNVGNAVYYPVPLHLQKCFEEHGYKKGSFPEAEKVSEEVISIPVYAELTRDQQDYVIDSILAGLL
ncbi:MAG: DegT/DnrJ/EryC1/StrS family aminotransferase [bacterium]|nr:DegT/DnrJ/EryC1/StrS family aminotransferase [bacterium]